MSPLTAWANYYVIVGTSAGALTGLTFVSITLVAGRQEEATSWGTATFTTPTVVHFGVVLYVAALLGAPWPALPPAAALLGLGALGALAYSAIVVRRLRRRTGYDPVLEDWLWYAALPLVAYAALIVAAFLLPAYPVQVLFGIAGVILLLLFLGIHNAWDVVTYVAVEQFTQKSAPHKGDASNENEE